MYKRFGITGMRSKILFRAAPAAVLTAVMIPVLKALSPVNQQAEAFLMAFSFALLAGLVFYIASGYIETPLTLLFIAAALAAGMVIRTLSLEHMTNDYLACLKPWAQSFRDTGWRAVADTWSDYNVPYLYIIGFISKIPLNDLYLYKLVSVLFDCGIIIAGLRIARVFRFGDFRRTALAAALFLAPTVWLNSAFWAQCDAIYAFFCLLTLAFVLENRPVSATVMAAAAFSFKLQAIFFLPIFAVLWMAKRIKWREIPVFLGAFIALFLPAWFLGRPFADIVRVYVNQSKYYSNRLNLNSPSAYALLWTEENHNLFFNAGLLLAFLFLGALLLLAWNRRGRLNDKTIFLFAAAMVIGIPWLLPSMHERYFYLADLFCVILAVMIPERWYFAPFCIFCSYAGYHAYLFNRYMPWAGLVIPSLIMLFLMGSAVMLTVKELDSSKKIGAIQD